jgi:hypothetical protein
VQHACEKETAIIMEDIERELEQEFIEAKSPYFKRQ